MYFVDGEVGYSEWENVGNIDIVFTNINE